jgi:hypothetical protein
MASFLGTIIVGVFRIRLIRSDWSGEALVKLSRRSVSSITPGVSGSSEERIHMMQFEQHQLANLQAIFTLPFYLLGSHLC